ncbi:MAG: hypothetical protein AVDCRST_MAG73-3623 [uncultured Thermomicrobiales bacterium]|uniref:Uncharacterized protein n=1 Tax=uncultured Thermomicrobiales bacterium TaxID=1645740 RepID=A0A6J4UW87_9BACT|nr:MAG: hypothetical protein AVDCRST_MAG73-3623 [uncultured Thermomicrobiales bacterium]
MATIAHQPTNVQPAPDDDDIPPIQWITEEESRVMFDEAAHATFGISGEEFLRRYDAGAYTPPEIFEGTNHSKLVEMEMLIPLVR